MPKISALPGISEGSIDSVNDVLPIVNTGTTYKVTLTDMVAAALNDGVSVPDGATIVPVAVNTGLDIYNESTDVGASVPLFLNSKSGGSVTNVSVENAGAGRYVVRTGASTVNGFGTERFEIAPDGAAKFYFAFDLPITTVSTDTTLDETHFTVLVDDSGATKTITLPAAAGCTGRIYNIKKLSALNTTVIDANGSETIDGALTLTLVLEYQNAQIQSNGTGWSVL